jgi:hypothetical protein
VPGGVVLLALLLYGPAAALAQGISGSVVDASTRAPVAGAAITINLAGATDRQRQTVMTDSLGRFRAIVGSAGEYVLRAEQLGYAPVVSQPLAVGVREMVTVELRMGPLPLALDPVIVQGRAPLRADGLDDYRRRMQLSRRTGFGRVYSREDIDAYPSASLNSLLQRDLRIRVVPLRFGSRLMVGGRGMACAPAVYLDGVFMGTTALTDLNSIVSLQSVEGIEIYRATEAPAELRTEGCGVIAVWTRRGEGGPFSWRRVAIGVGLAVIMVLSFR